MTRKDPLDDLAYGPITTADFTPAEQSLRWLNEEVMGLEDALIQARDREQKLESITNAGTTLTDDALRQTFPSLKK